MTFSSEIEKFQRATHQTPIFVGNSQGQDWKFQARLKFSSEIENFKRKLELFKRSSEIYFFQDSGPRGLRTPETSQHSELHEYVRDKSLHRGFCASGTRIFARIPWRTNFGRPNFGRPNSWVEFFDSVFFQQKRPLEKFTLPKKSPPKNSPSRIHPPKIGSKNIHVAPLQGHLFENMIWEITLPQKRVWQKECPKNLIRLFFRRSTQKVTVRPNGITSKVCILGAL